MRSAAIRSIALVFALTVADRASAAPRAPTAATDCDRIVRDQPRTFESYACYLRVAHHTGDFVSARTHLARILRRNPDEPGALAVFAAIGSPREVRAAAIAYRRAADRAETVGDRTTEVFARTRLSAVWIRVGQFDRAEQELEAIEARFGGQNPPVPVVLARARLDYAREDYGHATILLRQVEARLTQDAPAEQRADWLSQMAALEWSTNRMDEAFGLYTTQAELLHAAGDLYEEAVPRVNLILVTKGGSREFLRLSRDALALAKAGGNLPEEGRAAFFLAEFTSGGEALRHARRSLEIARLTGSESGVAMALRATASLTAAGDPAGAYRLIDEAIVRARRRGDLADEARDRVVRSRISWSRGSRNQGIADSLNALTAIEAERDLQLDALVRAQRFSAWRGIYCTLAGHLLAGHLLGPGESPSAQDVALAFQTVERMRARALLDAMDNAQVTAVLARDGDPDGIEELAARMTEVRRRLVDPTLETSERDVATAQFNRLEREVADRRASRASSSPAYAGLRPPHLATLDQAATHLQEDEALLSYQEFWDSGGDGTFLGGSWVIVRTRETTRTYRLAPLPEIAPRVRLFLGLVARRDGAERAAAARLYGDLLARPLADLPPSIHRLVIVPDDIVASVPFDALRPGPADPPLVTRYEVSLTPSVTVWLRWREAPANRAAAAALVVADPDLSSLQARSATANIGGVSPSGLRPLARAGREGRMVVTAIGGNSELRTGARASKRQLEHDDFSRFGVLHFATHAVVDESHPDRSALLLASTSPTDDGLLRPREIVAFRLAGQIVVLSACLTASGAVVGGDGIMGLSNAFFQAGAHAVVGSLWELEDEEAAAAMAVFYQHLGRGETVGTALAWARRERAASGAPTAAWSGLVIIGDATRSPIAGPDRAAVIVDWVIFATLALLGLMILLQYRPNSRLLPAQDDSRDRRERYRSSATRASHPRHSL